MQPAWSTAPISRIFVLWVETAVALVAFCSGEILAPKSDPIWFFENIIIIFGISRFLENKNRNFENYKILIFQKTSRGLVTTMLPMRMQRVSKEYF